MLRLLRYTMLAELVVVVAAIPIDAIYFPENVGLSLLTIVPDLIWLLYLFKSRRVDHVFRGHDWNVAVESIHPLKPTFSA